MCEGVGGSMWDFQNVFYVGLLKLHEGLFVVYAGFVAGVFAVVRWFFIQCVFMGFVGCFFQIDV